jgi:hypothetical protein
VIIWTRIRQLNIAQLFRFAVLFLINPMLLVPTFRAIKRTLGVCNTLFGNEHNKSTRANAFRHALWNILICCYSIKKTKNKDLSSIWTEKVTKNDILEKSMDLQNNTVGRKLFLEFLDYSEANIIILLQKKAKNAQKIVKMEVFQNSNSELVYILE